MDHCTHPRSCTDLLPDPVALRAPGGLDLASPGPCDLPWAGLGIGLGVGDPYAAGQGTEPYAGDPCVADSCAAAGEAGVSGAPGSWATWETCPPSQGDSGSPDSADAAGSVAGEVGTPCEIRCEAQ